MTAAGHGPDVLFVHGALGDCRQWSPIADRLRERFRVAAISRRYHWPNPPPPPDAEYSYESHCADLLSHLQGEAHRVHLVGHSWGAGVALLAALRSPGSLASLTLIEPPFASLLPESAPGLEEEVASRASMLDEVRARAAQGRHEDAARMLIDWLQGGPGGFMALAPEVRDVLLQNAATIGPTFSSPAPAITSGVLRELDVPSLVLEGERTRRYFALMARTAASCLPRARAARVPGAGHMLVVERPAETAALLLEFLQQ